MKPSTVSLVTYLIYALVWDLTTIGGCAYLVFWMDCSGWWFVLAVALASSAVPPHKWRRLWMPDPKEGPLT